MEFRQPSCGVCREELRNDDPDVTHLPDVNGNPFYVCGSCGSELESEGEIVTPMDSF